MYQTISNQRAPWIMGLLKTMKNPKYIVKADDQITMIKDLYPKAKHHFLVLPNEDICSLKSIRRDHKDLLKHMESSAKKYIEENFPNTKFNLGYHAQATMYRLHLHVISDDMSSPALKTKSHWNSFTTKFFVETKDVLESLESEGKVVLPSREKCIEYMATPLKCNKCNFQPKNMPELKVHIDIVHLNFVI